MECVDFPNVFCVFLIRFSEIELFIQLFLGIQKLLIVVLTYYFFRTIKNTCKL